MGDLQEYLTFKIESPNKVEPTANNLSSEMIILVPKKNIPDHGVGSGQGITSDVRGYDGDLNEPFVV